jgi:flagellar basal body-associated protein FliL
MKKIILLVLLVVFLSGCATYKFQRGKEPYNKGYVVSRDDYIIPEYTIGKDNCVPSIELAKERFKKRRQTVEYYYEKMGYIENKLKTTFWDPPVLFLKFIGGVFRLPSIAISDYKYEHNPQYREKIIKIQQEQDALEEARIQKLKDTLNSYIQKELAKEKS